jgi:hypothetical protein
MPHQLADKLFLASQRSMSRYALCHQDGIEQALVERYGPELTFLQLDQLLAEHLQGQMLAFSRTFTGL